MPFGLSISRGSNTDTKLVDYKAPRYSTSTCVMYNKSSYKIDNRKAYVLGFEMYDFEPTSTITSVRQAIPNGMMKPPPDPSYIKWKYKLYGMDGYINEDDISNSAICASSSGEKSLSDEFRDAHNVDALIAILDNPTNPSSKQKAVDYLKTKLNTTTLGANIDKIRLAFERNGIAYVPPRAVKYGGTRKLRKRKTRRKVRSLKSK